MSALTTALWITLIGMGLVFASILLLWGLMAVLVRLTASKEAAPEAVSAPAEATLPTPPSVSARKRQAAVAAVAAALALEDQTPPMPHLAPLPEVSAWQAVHRANMLNRQGRVR